LQPSLLVQQITAHATDLSERQRPKWSLMDVAHGDDGIGHTCCSCQHGLSHQMVVERHKA
jgi:hypothetical protein